MNAPRRCLRQPILKPEEELFSEPCWTEKTPGLSLVFKAFPSVFENHDIVHQRWQGLLKGRLSPSFS